MVVAYIMGGMGNQMFQYATAYALARRTRQTFSLDTSSFAHDNLREYQLNLWKGILEPSFNRLHGYLIEERGMPYNPILFDRLPAHVTMRGYWQTEKYFYEYQSNLAEIFLPKRALNSREANTLAAIRGEGHKSVFLTVRRTDYITKADFHGGMLPMDYYLKALSIIQEQVSDPHVFVFSDDVEWCEANFKLPCRMTIAGNFDRTVKGHIGREDCELFLMRNCRHAIMANSSYSWWGAWLGEADNADKVIVAPNRWFGPAAMEDPKDIVPERWIKI